ncbi:hypothetical protein FS749_003763 [Ceratobasidium sp. UAMH 11750]|nr:hypothetical protein FS749_003763 [Ceratobasidium sp. UAMH 11750]
MGVARLAFKEGSWAPARLSPAWKHRDTQPAISIRSRQGSLHPPAHVQRQSALFPPAQSEEVTTVYADRANGQRFVTSPYIALFSIWMFCTGILYSAPKVFDTVGFSDIGSVSMVTGMLGVCKLVATIVAHAFTCRPDASTRTIDSTHISRSTDTILSLGRALGPLRTLSCSSYVIFHSHDRTRSLTN